MVIKPILFNTDMVRAIQDGRKTVTRRVIKTSHKNAYGFNVVKNQGNIVGVIDYDENEIMFDNYTQPPYHPGDYLYVREAYRIYDFSFIDWTAVIQYRADLEIRTGILGIEPKERSGWTPSIHMPKEAARIWLKVKDVRVERLQDIRYQKEEMQREGVEICLKCRYKPTCDDLATARECFLSTDFRNLWDYTIKKQDLPLYGWDANPWVWVIEFERCEKP